MTRRWSKADSNSRSHLDGNSCRSALRAIRLELSFKLRFSCRRPGFAASSAFRHERFEQQLRPSIIEGTELPWVRTVRQARARPSELQTKGISSAPGGRKPTNCSTGSRMTRGKRIRTVAEIRDEVRRRAKTETGRTTVNQGCGRIGWWLVLSGRQDAGCQLISRLTAGLCAAGFRCAHRSAKLWARRHVKVEPGCGRRAFTCSEREWMASQPQPGSPPQSPAAQ